MLNTYFPLNTIKNIYIFKKKQREKKFTLSNRIAPVWNALLLTRSTKSAPNIHKFKDLQILLDRDPKLLVNKSDYDSQF